MANACPDRDRLGRYAAGRLDEPDTRAVEAHLAACPVCRRTADDLADETLTAQLRDAVGADPEQELPRQLQERVAGDYEVLGPLGRGAAGVVFKARDVRLGRVVAIKCPAGAGQRGRLAAMFEEARLLARINHPHVAAVYALSESPEPPFIVMEFVDGLPITEALAGQPIPQKLAVFRQVLSAVAELHRRGIVHRDLKPGNILVDRAGAAKVLDMGIAELVPVEVPGGDEVGPVSGTPAYLAPEQSRGAAPRPSADVFSLGIVLFELLTGQRPFAGERVASVVRAIRESDPPLPRSLNSEIPGPLQAIALAALERDPARRYPSAGEFLLDLERFLQGEPIVANPTLLADILDHGIDRHLDDLGRWQKDRLISPREADYFAERYGRLRHREEFWVLDSRRISFSQVVLHLGAWACVVSALLMVCFQWKTLSDAARIALPLGIFALLLAVGLYLWSRQTRRVALVLLMAACLTWPLFVATFFATMKWRFLAGPDDVLASPANITNAELVILGGTWTVLALLLWLRTRTSAFALIWGLSALALATAIFLWSGMKRWDPDEILVWYLVPGILLLGLAMALDLGWRQFYFATPLYVMSLAVLLVALTYLAQLGPTTKWLGVYALAREWGMEAPDPLHQIKYSFIINGAAFLVFGLLADRSQASWWLRKIAILLFWLAPTHLLLPIRLLSTEWAILPAGWTVPEVVLPIGALALIFASVPKQMKSFFFSGLAYVAVAVQRLTAAHFEDVYAWPVGLAVAGLLLALLAWRRPALFDRSAKGAAVSTGRRKVG